MPRSNGDGKAPGRPNDLWEAHARQLLRDLMYGARAESWKEMARRLEAVGVAVDPKVLANKVNRGRFSVVLLLQCMAALKVEAVQGLWSEFPPPVGPDQHTIDGGASRKPPA